MEQTKLATILDKHKKWLDNEEDGERANLQGANLQGADLRDADLWGANLQGADLRDADLRDADLRDADLWGANLRDANLRDANLRDADLRGADLRGANLWGADLRGADTKGVIHDATTMFYAIQCPEEGSFIAYKKAQGLIIKLHIPEIAKRSSATSRKCRCDKAEALEILNQDRTKADVTSVPSNWDKDFIYKVGEIVQVSDFDEDRWHECSTGIHFFITFDEAKNY